MISAGSVVATFIAGLFSFFSPCTIPLMPAYLACVSGVSAADLNGGEHLSDFRGRLVLGSLLYVLGLSTVFVISGTIIGGFGGTLQSGHAAVAVRVVEIGGGLLMVVFGLAVAGVLRAPWLMRQSHLELPQRIRRRGLAAAFPLGFVFGLAWTPCVGSFLAAALVLAAASATAWSGAVLLFTYGLGIGLPFLGVALLWASLPGLPRRLSRAAPAVTAVGGALTAVLGVFIATGLYSHVASWLVQFSVAQ